MSKEKKQVDPFATKENARAALFNPEQLHLLVAPDLSVMELLLEAAELEVSEVKEWNRQTKFEDEDPSAGWVQGLCAMLAKKRAGKQQKANVSVVPTVGTSSSSSDSHNKETEKTTKP